MNANRGGEKFHLDAFVFGGDDFHFVRRHFLASAAIEQNDFVGAEAQRSAGGVDRGITAADDNYTAADLRIGLQLDLPEELDTGEDAGDVFVFDLHRFADLRAEADEDGFDSPA